MKFSLWLERRNQKSATKEPIKKSALELAKRAASKNIHDMQHGRAGTMEPRTINKKSRGEQNRRAIRDQY
jgi:hypothetical protein